MIVALFGGMIKGKELFCEGIEKWLGSAEVALKNREGWSFNACDILLDILSVFSN